MSPRFKKILKIFSAIFGCAVIIGVLVALTLVFSKSTEKNLCSTGELVVEPNPSDPLREKELGELLSVVVSFRHGPRSPIDVFSFDTNLASELLTEIGIGELTPHGKELMYRYGQELRKRYATYLDRVPLRNVRAQSSPKRRVVESTISVLASMFWPKTAKQTQHWSNTLSVAHQWQPIGVSMIDLPRAYALGDDPDCPRADQMFHNQQSSDIPPELTQFLNEHRDFIQRVVSVLDDERFNDWIEIKKLYNPLVCETEILGNQFQMPPILLNISANIWNDLERFNDFYYNYPRYLSSEYVHLKGGPFVANMLQAITNDTDPSLNGKKENFIHLMGTHDTTLSNALILLDLFSNEQPSYGSGLIVEVRSDPLTQTPTVHLYYANGTQAQSGDHYNCDTQLFDIYPLSLNESSVFKAHCPDTSCPLNTFYSVIQPSLPVDIEQECQIKE